jgi:hypothetical protein
MTSVRLLKYICVIVIGFITLNNSSAGYLDKSFNKIIIDTSSDTYGKIIAKDMKSLFEYKMESTDLLEYVGFLYKTDENIDIIEHTFFKVKIKRSYIYDSYYNKYIISCTYLIEENSEEIESCSYNEELLEIIDLELNKNVNTKNYEAFKAITENEYKANLNKNLLRSVYENYLNMKISDIFLKVHLGENELIFDSPKIDISLNILNNSPKIDFIDKYSTKIIKEEGEFISEKIISYNFMELRCETVISNQIFKLMESFGIEIDDKSNLQLIEYTKFPKLEFKSSCINIK